MWPPMGQENMTQPWDKRYNPPKGNMTHPWDNNFGNAHLSENVMDAIEN